MNSGEKKIISKHMSELGKKGGKNKWAKVSPEERSKRMKKMADIRWGNKVDK